VIRAFEAKLNFFADVGDIPKIPTIAKEVKADVLRMLADVFREELAKAMIFAGRSPVRRVVAEERLNSCKPPIAPRSGLVRGFSCRRQTPKELRGN